MYSISRFLLAIALLQFAFCGFLITMLWWPWPLLAIVFGVAWMRRHNNSLFAHGTARWADEEDLRRAGMMGVEAKGLSIGQLAIAEPLPWRSSVLAILNQRFRAKEACDRCLSRLTHAGARKKGERVVRLSNAVHTAVFGPTSAGKGTSFIIPFLLESDESAVVIDFKGEAAIATAKYRERVFGHRVVMLDPFCKVTNHPDSLNPVELIEKDSPYAIDDCRDLAEQLVFKTGEEREPHWHESAEMWIAAALIAVVQDAKAEDRSLQTVREILSNRERIPKLMEHLSRSGGLIARMGNQLSYFVDRELGSTLTTANRMLRFLDSPAIEASTTTSSFDPRSLRGGKMTVFCILPLEHARAQTSWLRMNVGTLMKAVVKEGLQHV